MMRYLFILVFFHCLHCSAQDVKFRSPLQGANGKDFYLVYFDHDTSGGVQDAFCGNNTYDGNAGTDFLLRSFPQMDSGVTVYAMADGQVIGRSDGSYDRHAENTSPGRGNYIEILHGDYYAVHYSGLMRGSLLVQRGQMVRAGQPIAKVGSSGMSTGPHLHLEVNDGYGPLDPFGSCTQRNSLWVADPGHDTTVYEIESGFVPYVPALDSIKSRFAVRDSFSTLSDTTICFWALMHGLQKSDRMRVEWTQPDGKPHFSYKYTWPNSAWVDYFWNYIKMPQEKGLWLVKFYVNDKLYTTRSFYVKKR